MQKSNSRYKDDNGLVVAKEVWQHGIRGIVASKLTEKYYKPTILLGIENGEATGSARSIKGVNIFEALIKCKDLMTKFGGHEQAAGLSLDSDNVEVLANEISKFADYTLTEDDMIAHVNVVVDLQESVINLKFVEGL
ncbi:DHHA1 domain-containing protein, partial [Clostridioides difficile]|uniref:DHHA1 domain-containing protein n=1 Tax=Clostridioides difficile TaxID=1496 RepID=UPI001EEE88E2